MTGARDDPNQRQCPHHTDGESIRNLPFDVEPLSGALGAVLHGVDLARLDDALFAAIEKAWLKYLVVFFVDQELTPEQQISFARRLGDIHYHPYMQGLDEHPDILEIVKEPGSSYTFGSEWHSDQMFSPQPAKATMLYAKETPSTGGDTLFANMYFTCVDTSSSAFRWSCAARCEEGTRRI